MRSAQQFSAFSRLIHWAMAAMIIAMLFIGVGMVTSPTGRYAELVSIHKPLGIAILALVVVRIVNRWANRPPPLPRSVPQLQRAAAHTSHLILYGLMIAMPLVGWGMLSAAGYPIVLYGPLSLPAILPQNPGLYAGLRTAHSALAYLLFATVVVHLGAALFHGLIRRDGVLESMASVAPRR
ncbi:Cytochrome b561 [Methylobacterium crusticola]|uniref:Cytochrome b561 n=1 Tax=Methylobacterium crusticola TaxID=1697972 RepID=A0ABQ4R214_9HYPH|nr:cytochrome b [Methylobacterium crusticola]GJD51713.1 Cytochrome b561 [Methylobacterium crusticola]